MVDAETLREEIRELIEQRKWSEVRRMILKVPAPDITELLHSLEKYDRVLLFRLLPGELTAEVFSYFDAVAKDSFLKELTGEETRRLLADMPPDDRTELLAELPGQVVQRLLNLLSPGDLSEARQLLGYPEESIGRLMTPDYVAVREDWTISRALDHIRAKGKVSETINVIYVIDGSWKLLDALGLKHFVLALPDLRVKEIMDYSYVAISAYEDREKAVELIRHYDLDALPVVDSAGVLLGIITVDDVMDVAEKETTEDFEKTAAVLPLKKSYSESGFFSLYRKRILWLMALIVVNLLSAEIIAAYEETLLSSIALAFFIPLLIASGGNAGAQSATLMVRAIAVGDVELDQWLWAVGKEMTIGILLGLTMGLGSWVLGLYRGGVGVAMVVALSMISIVVAANVIGVILPFLLTRFRLDPAVVSNPLITSIIDVAGLAIYFSIASAVLGL